MASEIQGLSKRRKWVPFFAIASDWALIGGAVAISIHFQNWGITALALLVIGARQHALFSMVHEAVHMHIAQNKWLNDWTSDLFCALPLIFDTDFYRRHHLQHHRHLNTNQDPDWVRKAGRKEWTFPVSRGQLLAYIPYFVFFRAPLEWAMILWIFTGFGSKARWKAEGRYLLFKMAYFSCAIAAVLYFGCAREVTLYWLTPMFFVLPGIGRIRSVAEHFALGYQDEYNSTRDVPTGLVENFLISPHNLGYHLTHHVYPQIPFYNLARAHALLRKTGEFSSAHINSAYVFPFGNSVLKDVLRGPSSKRANASNKNVA